MQQRSAPAVSPRGLTSTLLSTDNGYYRPDKSVSNYYYSHGFPGFVLIQIGAASDGAAEEDTALAAAPACPAGAGPKQPTPKCTAGCPDAPSTGGWSKYPHTCPNDPSTCPPGAAVCGCTRSQLGSGKCSSRESCHAAALGRLAP